MLRGVRPLAWVILPSAAAGLLVLTALPRAEGQAGKEELAVKARAILKANCYSCHGDPAKPLKGKQLDLFKPACYLDKDRKIVVPGDPDASKLIQRIEDEEDNRMPPPDKGARLSQADARLLRDWIAAGAPAYSGRTTEAPAPADDLPAQAEKILKARCYGCHGDPARPPKKKLNLFDPASYLDKARQVVVPGDPAASRLIQRIEDDDSPMPPKGERVPQAERQVLRDWIAAGAAAFGSRTVATRPAETAPAKGPAETAPAPAPPKDPRQLAADVKQLFRQRCAQCHGSGELAGGLNILDHPALLKDGTVTPSKPEASELYSQIKSERMPKPGGGRAPLTLAEKDLVRDWIAAGAPAFPDDVTVAAGSVGDDYVLRAILQDVRKVKEGQADAADFVRYFSINHLLAAGATEAELEDHRKALALAVNSLSLLKDFERPVPVEPTNTVFRVDLRNLGWEKQPYEGSDLNLFDLVLLEYPYGVAAVTSPAYDALADEFLARARQVRPVPYVRGDWFVSVATQPPLYEDFLQLPFEEKQLEERLGVDTARAVEDGTARRAGLSVSGVSHNNRVIERHRGRRVAYYWKSYDFRSSKGADNIFQDPVNLRRAGGEMIFPLQNGLQAYFVCNARGERLAVAPTEIVTDDNAADRAVRNGLSCIRCHANGMRDRVQDEVRPAVRQLPGNPGTFDKRDAERLYADAPEMAQLLKEDRRTFEEALKTLFGESQTRGSVLTGASRRFLDWPLPLPIAAAELGQGNPAALQNVFRSRDFAALGLVQLGSRGSVRRDTWEDFYDQVVRNLNAGEPLVPLDGVTRANYQPAQAPFELEVTRNKPGAETKNRVQVVLVNKTDANRGVFAANDKVEVQVINNTAADVFVEIFFNSFQGKKPILPPGRVQVKRGETFKYDELTVQPTPGSEQVVVFASDAEFPAGERLRVKKEAEGRGEAVGERVVHRFYELERNGRNLRLKFDPSRVVKRTLDIETR